MSGPTPRDRLMGGLIGVLVGDALGVPVEFTGRAIRDMMIYLEQRSRDVS